MFRCCTPRRRWLFNGAVFQIEIRVAENPSSAELRSLASLDELVLGIRGKGHRDGNPRRDFAGSSAVRSLANTMSCQEASVE